MIPILYGKLNHSFPVYPVFLLCHIFTLVILYLLLLQYLVAPLFVAFAGVKKFALALLLPNAGAGGGALTEERLFTKERVPCFLVNT